jgi:hypothetical protein
MAQNFFVQNSTVGTDLNNGSATALFAVGTHLLGTQGSEWVYVQANTSIVGNTVVAFNSAFTCGMASGGDLTTGQQLAIAQTSISSQAFGWVAIRGDNLTCAITGTASFVGAWCLAASDVPTGVLSNTITASNTLGGVQMTATASGSVASFAVTWPRGFAAGVG